MAALFSDPETMPKKVNRFVLLLLKSPLLSPGPYA